MSTTPNDLENEDMLQWKAHDDLTLNRLKAISKQAVSKLKNLSRYSLLSEVFRREDAGLSALEASLGWTRLPRIYSLSSTS